MSSEPIGQAFAAREPYTCDAIVTLKPLGSVTSNARLPKGR
jgi:hypothetical protein